MTISVFAGGRRDQDVRYRLRLMSIRKSLYRDFRRQQPGAFGDAPPGGIEIVTTERDVAEAEAAAAQWLPPNAPPEWRETGVMYQDAFVSLLKDPVRFPDGRMGSYFRVAPPPGRPESVAVLPVLHGSYVFIRHFRHATRRFHWETPRGYGEPGVTPEDNARRELVEELGADVLSVTSMGPAYAETGYLASPFYMLWADIASTGALETGDGIVDSKVLSRGQTIAAIASGEIDDCITLALVMRHLALQEHA
jgi:ADP-ribose pyrophosphatase